jgi:hypothetical protein
VASGVHNKNLKMFMTQNDNDQSDIRNIREEIPSMLPRGLNEKR